MTATPTVNFNVFFKKIDSRIALTLVLPRTGLQEKKTWQAEPVVSSGF